MQSLILSPNIYISDFFYSIYESCPKLKLKFLMTKSVMFLFAYYSRVKCVL